MLTALIFAKDHDAMVAFYRTGFGLSVVEHVSSPGYTVLADGTTRLAIHAVPPEVAEGITITDPPAARPNSAVKLVFEVPEPATTCERLEHLGGQILGSGDDEARDALDIEGNVFRIIPALSSWR